MIEVLGNLSAAEGIFILVAIALIAMRGANLCGTLLDKQWAEDQKINGRVAAVIWSRARGQIIRGGATWLLLVIGILRAAMPEITDPLAAQLDTISGIVASAYMLTLVLAEVLDLRDWSRRA